MAEQEPEYPGQEELFSYLVSTFYSSAWMQMGKMANPVTNKVERDLEQAQFSIDLLDMLKQKTEGNLTEQEKTLLDRAVKELKMNYMEEMKKDKQESSKADSGADESGADSSDETASQGPKNIVTPDEAIGGEKDDDDSGESSSNLWTP